VPEKNFVSGSCSLTISSLCVYAWSNLYSGLHDRRFVFLLRAVTKFRKPSIGHAVSLGFFAQYFGWSYCTRWCSWLRHRPTSRKVAGSIPNGVIENFSLTSFPPHYGPWVESASNRNEYQEYFLFCKGGRCVGLTSYHFPVSIVFKSGSLNLLEPSGSVQACTGIAFTCTIRWINTLYRNFKSLRDLSQISSFTLCVNQGLQNFL